MSDRLARLLETRPWLLADGATGTNYFAMGLETGDAPELWNVDHPERVLELHRRFLEAGSDIILTNTFGGSRYRLKLHGAQDRVAELNSAAARLARQAGEESGREVVVAGSMGPTGEILEPIGPLPQADAEAAFAEQAAALAEGGADVLWIETISSVEELEAAVKGAGTTGLPLVVTMSFDTNGRTMMGVTSAQVADLVHGLSPRPAAYGGNCGIGPAELMAALINLGAARKPGDILIAKSNCGVPEYIEGEIVYSGTPPLMADYARLALDAGVRIIGGCCGTTPEHIRAMRDALETHEPAAPPTLDEVVARLGPISKGAEKLTALGYLDLGAEEAKGGGRRRRGRRRGAAEGGKTPRF
jgi:5-methyltetrahydrofolate--homocysteine methyltransferase